MVALDVAVLGPCVARVYFWLMLAGLGLAKIEMSSIAHEIPAYMAHRSSVLIGTGLLSYITSAGEAEGRYIEFLYTYAAKRSPAVLNSVSGMVVRC